MKWSVRIVRGGNKQARVGERMRKKRKSRNTERCREKEREVNSNVMAGIKVNEIDNLLEDIPRVQYGEWEMRERERNLEEKRENEGDERVNIHVVSVTLGFKWAMIVIIMIILLFPSQSTSSNETTTDDVHDTIKLENELLENFVLTFTLSFPKIFGRLPFSLFGFYSLSLSLFEFYSLPLKFRPLIYLRNSYPFQYSFNSKIRAGIQK